MDFGVSYFPTDESIEPAEMAQLCEQRGFESMFVTDHTHIPASRETPYPAGGDLPPEYARIHDPFVALATAAQATETIKLGTAVCLLVERDPIVTAKQAASIDALSGGRFLFGVGAGWNREEMANHGTDPRTRMKLLAERVEAMKAIWTQDEASYHGRFVDFDRIWSWPKPAQAPHPPVLVGGNGPTVLDRAEAFGDAWFPNFARGNVLERIPEARERGIPVLVMTVPADAKALEQLREAGEAVRAIWTEDEASYHGAHVDFDDIWCWPKPVQPGGPPVLLGGNGPKVLDRVLRYADAWFPNRIGAEEHNIPRMEELQRRASDEGRDPIPVTLQIPPRDPDSLRRYEAAGVTRAVHMMRPTDAADTASAEAKLDGWAERAAAYSAG